MVTYYQFYAQLVDLVLVATYQTKSQITKKNIWIFFLFRKLLLSQLHFYGYAVLIL